MPPAAIPIAAVGVEAGLDATLAAVAADALVGAGLGAVTSGITGGDPGIGALTGGITGGAIGGAGGTIGEAVGSATAGDIIAGAAGGALGAGVTGTDPLTGAVSGGAAGLISALGAPGGGAAGLTETGAGAEVPGAAGLAEAGAAAPAIPAGGATGTVPASVAAGGAAASPDIATLAAFGGPGAGAAAASPGAVAADLGLNTPVGVGTVPDNPLANVVPEPKPALNPITGEPPETSLGRFLTAPSGKTAADVAVSNPSAVLGALGLGYQALTAPSLPSTSGLSKTLKGQAGQLGAEAGALKAPLFTGKLPPGAQAAVDQATNAAKQRLIANYAARGMDTDPRTNASLAQELSSIDRAAAGQVFQLADQLYQQGLSESGLSAELYNQLLSTTTAAQGRIGEAVSRFAGSLAGAPGLTVNIGAPGAPAEG